jgi:hypothetical protein
VHSMGLQQTLARVICFHSNAVLSIYLSTIVLGLVVQNLPSFQHIENSNRDAFTLVSIAILSPRDLLVDVVSKFNTYTQDNLSLTVTRMRHGRMQAYFRPTGSSYNSSNMLPLARNGSPRGPSCSLKPNAIA